MWAASEGHSNLGIPEAVGKEYVKNDAQGQPMGEDGKPAGDLSDMDAAEAVRDGELPSPTKYENFWLFDMRVTGTGMAWRDSISEWAHRDPKEWLSPAFVSRAGAVPVIWLHPPPGAGLNSEEFRERSIGNTVLSYVKDDEVWAVAKIFDADAAEAMQTTHTSTSPGVTPPKGSTSVELNNGTKVLDEGLPLVLDHLAICEMGVWDKDGPPAGIRLDAVSRKDASVTEEEKKALEKERDDAKMKLDAYEKADAARKDAEEKEKADKAKKDESDKEAVEAAEKEKADKAKKDAADKKKDARKDRHSKHDGDIMDCSRCDSEESEEEKEREDKAKKDAAAAKEAVDADRGMLVDSVKTMQATLDRQAAQIAAMTAQPTIADANEIAAAWGRWDSLYQMHGEQTPAAYPGEKPRAYLRRLADGMRKFTKGWKEYAFHDSQHALDFEAVSNLIFAEAEASAKNPVIVDGKRITREKVTHPHGKTRTEFIGDSRDFFAPFMHPTKFAITRINRPTAGNVYGE
jgi:hypothetical protein